MLTRYLPTLACLIALAGCGDHERAKQLDDGGAGEGGGAGALGFECLIPDAQLFDIIHQGATLSFSNSDGVPIELGSSTDPNASEPDEWLEADSLVLAEQEVPYALKVFARLADQSCRDTPRFEHIYEVRALYPGAAGDPASGAVEASDASIVAWASEVVEPVSYGSDLDDAFKTPELALGPAEGNSFDIVALGNGGSITLRFDPPIRNGDGPDFLVFENGFSDTFLEFGFVEVSSDGSEFVRFDSAYLGTEMVTAFGMQEPSLVAGLAGKHRQGFGTPFDLELLRYRTVVQLGRVDLGAVGYVRIVDIVGDGSEQDAFGQAIYDPSPTAGSAGFDLDGIGVFFQGP